MFDVFKLFWKVLWTTYSECSKVKAYYKVCFDYVVVVGVEMYVIVSVCGFAVDFTSLIILRFNYYDVQEEYGVIRLFFIDEIDGGFNVV